MCNKCGSDKILSIQSHGRDCNVFRIKNYEMDGYVPDGLGISGGDDVYLSVCLNCGYVQNWQTVDDEKLNEVLSEYFTRMD